MFRNYEDKRIYRNLKICMSTSIVAFIEIFLILIYFLVVRFGLAFEKNQIIFIRNIEEDKILLLFIFLFLIPFDVFAGTFGLLKHHPNRLDETPLNNDYANTLVIAIFSFIPLVVFSIISLNCFILVSELHMPIYASCACLIQNCVLIKRSWKKDPPFFVLKAQEQQEKINEAKKAQQDMEQYRTLIEQCGIKFFIKYYRQIVRLPLRDVAVTENYSSQERVERLNAAKKIIDLGLSEFALTDILKKYGDILEIAEVEQAKELLANIQTPSQSS